MYNVTARGVGIICYKVVNGRYMEKRVNVRIEHVRHSACRKEFLERVKSNAAKKKEAKEKGEFVQLKRLPAQPRESRVVSIKGNAPETLRAKPCEFWVICIVAQWCATEDRRGLEEGRVRGLVASFKGGCHVKQRTHIPGQCRAGTGGRLSGVKAANLRRVSRMQSEIWGSVSSAYGGSLFKIAR